MLLARLQRAAQAELLLHRTEAEAARLIEAIQDARGGRSPRWPVPSGTPLDGVLRELAGNQS